ncbi:retinol dehydrogenase 12-like [Labeo rohita]|uniref:retinol dehydrogenase 12-like n=1 Tax=Labeo rohita TaxID=84645 RepID=UPI0021E20DCE|nr:retinol dehydrogenase 12-like [Labeo rohita]
MQLLYPDIKCRDSAQIRRRLLTAAHMTAKMIFFSVNAFLLVAYCVFRRIFVHRKAFTGTAKLYGKTVIVTGANSGIGRATAAQLALRGARVILACRNKQRGEAAAQAIRKETENDAVIFMHLDLASQKSIRSFAETFLKTEPRLDLLVNNAGLATTGRNEDGLGMILAVNHIGPFLLTNLLLERLKECAPSRVINVSSLVHHVGTIDFDCINTHKTLNLGSSDYDVFWDYSSSKLCNVLFTHELAKRLEGTNVTCYSVYPGSVKTELNRDINEWFTCILKFIIGTFLVTDAVSGAQTTLYCALQENIEHLSGKYFSDSQVMQVKPEARDDGIAKKLWDVSEKLCGIA